MVYPDILLRDYARLILERWIYESPSDFGFIDTTKIRPPYRSAEVPNVEKQEYVNRESNRSGFNLIDYSMRVNCSGSPGIYGDFGRYTFQSALNSFEGLDILNLYHYAMQYIRDTLGYSDNLFSNYDCFQNRYGRYDNKKTERIGKKYQWITFYNMLARISDSYPLKDWNGNLHPYEGAWEPYIRDFDPTLNIHFLKPDSLPIIQYPILTEEIFLQTESFPSEKEIKGWTRSSTSLFENLSDRLILTDVDGTEWINLNLYEKSQNKQFETNGMFFTKGSQEIWLSAPGYFIKPNTFEELKRQPISWPFITDFPHGLEVYQLFNREYSWAPGCQSIFQSSCFEANVEIGEKHIIKEYVDIPRPLVTNDGEFRINFCKEKIEKLVPSDVIHVKVTPTYSHFLWEGEYDASQKDTTSFKVPCREIIECLHLEQRENDGYYFNPDGILVCFDAALSGICNGLLIRKDYLDG